MNRSMSEPLIALLCENEGAPRTPPAVKPPVETLKHGGDRKGDQDADLRLAPVTREKDTTLTTIRLLTAAAVAVAVALWVLVVVAVFQGVGQ
jgi:hypothetical protein